MEEINALRKWIVSPDLIEQIMTLPVNGFFLGFAGQHLEATWDFHNVEVKALFSNTVESLDILLELALDLVVVDEVEVCLTVEFVAQLVGHDGEFLELTSFLAQGNQYLGKHEHFNFLEVPVLAQAFKKMDQCLLVNKGSLTLRTELIFSSFGRHPFIPTLKDFRNSKQNLGHLNSVFINQRVLEQCAIDLNCIAEIRHTLDSLFYTVSVLETKTHLVHFITHVETLLILQELQNFKTELEALRLSENIERPDEF